MPSEVGTHVATSRYDARAGEVDDLTSIDQPYERPAQPDLALDTAQVDVATNVKTILAALEQRGWIAKG